MRRFLAIPIVFLLAFSLHGADLIRVSALTKNIVLVEMVDGVVVQHGYGQSSDIDTAFYSSFNGAVSMSVSSYRITSIDDSGYSSAQNPTAVRRKSKGFDFSRKCKWNGEICDNDYASRHFMYLVLPSELKSGSTYQVDVEGAFNIRSMSFVFDETTNRSDAIHVNQIGFEPGATSKYAYVSHWMGDGQGLDLDDFNESPFQVVDLSTGNSVFSGQLTLRFRKDQEEIGQPNDTPGANFSVADVWECDFSALSVPGEYIVVVEGIGSSYPFEIKENILREAFYLTARSVYHQRSGIERTAETSDWPRPADHNPSVTPGFEGKLQYTTSRWIDWPSEEYTDDEILDGRTGPIDTYGWYHDAGDWDGYSRHADVPAYLLTVYEMRPENFTDGELNIPESGNGIPDILDEAAWLIDFYKRTKGPTGGVAGGRVHGNFASPGSGVPSYEDPREWIVSGEDPVTSFRYAGLATQYAYHLRNLGFTEKAEEYYTDADTVYKWAKANTTSEERQRAIPNWMSAAAWLFRYTGDSIYQAEFKINNQVTANSTASFENQRWGVWAYASIDADMEGLDTALHGILRQASLNYADENNLRAYDDRSFRFGGNWFYPILIGQATTPMVIESVMAYEISGDEKYLRCVQNTADYMLGGNPLNMCWISGLGDQSPMELLNLDSWYDNKPQMIEGIVPYGPFRLTDDGYDGPWNSNYALDRIYPTVENWPGHEIFFENRYCPVTNEYTVWQTLAPSAAIYGYLSSPTGTFERNQAPTIQITSPQPDDFFDNTPMEITAVADDADGRVTKVEYYQSWRKIGEATEAPYTLNWQSSGNGEIDIIAKAYDNEGRFVFSDTLNVRVENVLGKTDAPSLAFSIFPNPTQEHIHIHFNLTNRMQVSMQLVDLSGKTVVQNSLGELSPGQHQKDLHLAEMNLSNGIYILKIQGLGKQSTIEQSRKLVFHQ
ncbi:MAG: glycoside hydrolase family 9 protein [Cyclobacteriaceae bacterium]|nr:glycoside hydrolase family 9 protein [Cyclobacteriaceae bacterium HetDA_MAG_MS6]